MFKKSRDALSVELDFEVVHLSDLIDSPSPNYRYVLQKAQEGAVANNEQIVSGIKYGVREAVSEVLAPYLADIAQNTRETANKDFSTYIGDKEIARATERGRRAMGLQLITEF